MTQGNRGQTPVPYSLITDPVRRATLETVPMLLYLIVGAVAYLLGSIPFGLILVRIFRKQDIRQQGSGNIGATNVIRSGGKGLGAATFLLDAAKGYAACCLRGSWRCTRTRHNSRPRTSRPLRHFARIVGHVYPVWLGFKGGKGVATGFGVFLGIAAASALVALPAFILIFALSRYVSLASIIAAIVSLWRRFSCTTSRLRRS